MAIIQLWWALELMRHSKPVRLETAPTGGESVFLFLEFTIKNLCQKFVWGKTWVIGIYLLICFVFPTIYLKSIYLR